MAGFCTKCGRPLPESGICPCTQQAAQPAPQQPQYQQPQYQQPQYQPQYQQPQYQQYYQQPQYQPAPQQPAAPKEPSAFGLAFADLPKKFVRLVKDPAAELRNSVEKKDMFGGIIGMAIAVTICFFVTLFCALRWKNEYFGFPAGKWLLAGLVLPVLACGFTFLGYFVLSKVGKVQADMKGLLAVTGTGALIPAALTAVSLLFSMVSPWFFNAFGILIVAAWAILAFVTVFQALEIQPKALTLLVLLGFCFVSYYCVAWIRDVYALGVGFLPTIGISVSSLLQYFF